MHIDHMREFLIVADEKSMTLAAQRLQSTQPVVSKHVRALEDTLGNQLLIRSTKGIALTPQGVKAYRAFKDIIARYDDLIGQMTPRDAELCGQIKIGILSTGFDRYMMPIINRFHQDNPNVSFSYAMRRPHAIINGVLDGSIDIGFLGAISTEKQSQLSFRYIGSDKIHFVLAKSDPLAQNDNLSPTDLEGRPLVCLDTKETTDAINELLFSAGYRPSKIIYTSEVEVAPMEVILSDGGYFAIPEFMRGTFSSYDSIAVRDTSAPLFLPIHFVYKAKSHNPIVAAFLDWVELHWNAKN